MSVDTVAGRRPGRGWGRWVGASLLLAIAAATLWLGVWQLQRLDWKRDLLARIERGMAMPPGAPPEAGVGITRAEHEYRRLRLTGVFDHDRETLVGASTVLGVGYWLLTPLHGADGRWTWINRGFVPRRDAPRQRPAGPQVVEGLLRLTEPGGSLLQQNRPDEQRWYSRDVAALSTAARVSPVAPYFVDVWPEPAANQAGEPPLWPHPGLTVLKFSNNHRGYALTWFALAAMALGGAVFLIRLRANPHDPE